MTVQAQMLIMAAFGSGRTLRVTPCNPEHPDFEISQRTHASWKFDFNHFTYAVVEHVGELWVVWNTLTDRPVNASSVYESPIGCSQACVDLNEAYKVSHYEPRRCKTVVSATAHKA